MKKKVVFAVLALILLINACNSSPSEADVAVVVTAAMQTIEANFTQTAAAMPAAQETKAPEAMEPVSVVETATETPVSTPTLDTRVAPENCLLASLYNENVPDGTILSPGENFTKRWYLLNQGECTWNQDYKLLFWDGSLMGGYTEYNFPDIARPGESIELPIMLQAPTTAGRYTGYWKMQSKSGYIFGVGEYQVPISVSIDVREGEKVEYGITSVEYELTRDPPFECTPNVTWTIHATVSVSGPMDIRYQFYQRESDGEIVKQAKRWLRFTEAGIKTITNDWVLNQCVNNNPRFFSLVILDPITDTFLYQYPEYQFAKTCPDLCP